MNSVIIIPARLQSTRLPRKLLLAETGRPLIQHTYEATRTATKPSRWIVAADDPEIEAAVQSFGGECFMTDPALPSGTDRVAAVAQSLSDVDVIVNVQGDEPEIRGEAIDLLIDLLENDPEVPMATLATPIRSREILEDPARVKVVCDLAGRAMYFSRATVPFARSGFDSGLSCDPAPFLLHIGMYAYRRDFLLRLTSLPQTPCEKLESLEQLRVLEHGYPIRVGLVDEPTRGIDTPRDYESFVKRWRN